MDSRSSHMIRASPSLVHPFSTAHPSPKPGLPKAARLFRHLLRFFVSRIVFRAEVFQSKRPHRGYLRDVLAVFRPAEMRCVARENDHSAGWIGLQLTRVEFITHSAVKDAGYGEWLGGYRGKKAFA